MGLIQSKKDGSLTTPARKSWFMKRFSTRPTKNEEPALPKPNPEKLVFGVKLRVSVEQSFDYNTSHESKFVPVVVRCCCAFLNNKGLEEEGVYRIPGNRKNIELFQARFNSGEPVDFIAENALKRIDPYDVAGLLLQFFKSLPESIFTDILHSSFINIPWKEFTIEQKIKKLKELLSLLPDINLETIRCLMTHFYEVKQLSKINHMTTKNLVLCVYGTSPYAPVFFNLIEHYESVFGKSEDAAIAPPSAQLTPISQNGEQKPTQDLLQTAHSVQPQSAELGQQQPSVIPQQQQQQQSQDSQQHMGTHTQLQTSIVVGVPEKQVATTPSQSQQEGKLETVSVVAEEVQGEEEEHEEGTEEQEDGTEEQEGLEEGEENEDVNNTEDDPEEQGEENRSNDVEEPNHLAIGYTIQKHSVQVDGRQSSSANGQQDNNGDK